MTLATTATTEPPTPEPEELPKSPWTEQENLIGLLMVLLELAERGIKFKFKVDYTPANPEEGEIFKRAMRDFWQLFPPDKGPRNPWKGKGAP
jgi:hypothetical protein